MLTREGESFVGTEEECQHWKENRENAVEFQEKDLDDGRKSVTEIIPKTRK